MTLRLDGLSCRFGELTALDGLSFEVPEGSVVGFLGPNGAGKTTAMRAVFGLVEQQGGSITWRGAPVGSRERRHFGYLPEERGLYPAMAVREQVEYLGRLHGLSRSEASSAAGSWLERLGVSERSSSKVEALSLGNQQRVQLAAALVHDPDLLVLDEPLSGLDPNGLDAVGSVLLEQAAAGKAVLFSSHQLDLVEHLCSAVAIIDAGRLVAYGSVDELERGGAQRLVVRLAGERDPAWAARVPGVVSCVRDGGTQRLVLASGADSQLVLAAAMAAGSVVEFGFERRRLSEVFREAVLPAGAAAAGPAPAR